MGASGSLPPLAHPNVAIAVVRGRHGSGIVLQEKRFFDEGLTAASTLTLLVHRNGRIAPLGPALRIVGGLSGDTSNLPPGERIVRVDQVEIDLQGNRVDAVCTVPIDWRRGLLLPRDAVCRAWAHEPTQVPLRGRIVLYASPRPGAPSRTTALEAGMPVRILRARGEVAPALGFAPTYLQFRERWIEVEVASRRGWLHRSEDIELLGIFVERC